MSSAPMASDRETLREVWDGRIPVCFTLAADEIDSETPEPVFVTVPRHSYFPLVTDKVSKTLSHYVQKENIGEFWLDFESQPLKWHYPIGVLYDLFCGPADLPWKLTVHFQNFPEEELLHCPSKDAVESHYMSSVKEADALKHRSHIINGMQKRDHKQLWSGITNDKFDQFWSVNRKMMENSGDEAFKYIPFKIYQMEKPCIQKLFKPTSEEGHEHTLTDLLKLVLHLEPGTYSEDLQTLRVVVQGIEPPLETSVVWLSEHLSHPDNFLHICVLPKQTQELTNQW